MRIAILQFSPKVGDIAANFSRAESLLMRREREGELNDLDVLVLPELAFTGYNHPSLAAIAPFLEPTAAGPSTRWAARTARRLKCTVAVGYPEAAEDGNFNTVYDSKISVSPDTVAYNSLVIVNHLGDVVAHYRKSFLYYTDATWAKEGSGFYKGVLPYGNGVRQMTTAAGICMDINPYKFQNAWTEYEFANHAREAKAQIVLLSMAWLTLLDGEEMTGELAFRPDEHTIGYWIERFRPLLGAGGPADEVLVVFANRAGEEGHAPIIGEVRYAGSSCVMAMKGDPDGNTNVRIWDIMGRAQDGVLVTDTRDSVLYSVDRKAPPTSLNEVAVESEPPAMNTKIEKPPGWTEKGTVSLYKGSPLNGS